MDQQTARQTYQEASTLFAAGQYTEALVLLNKLHVAFPDNLQVAQAREKCQAAIRRAGKQVKQARVTSKRKMLIAVLLVVAVLLVAIIAAVYLVLFEGAVGRLFAHFLVTELTYDDFPDNIKQDIDACIVEMRNGYGVCMAGRVLASDGYDIKRGDVELTLYRDNYAYPPFPVRLYDGGWFLSPVLYPDETQISFSLRAFGYNPIDTAITILAGEGTHSEGKDPGVQNNRNDISIHNGEMSYLDVFVLLKTLPKDYVTISGTVFDKNENPINGAHVSLTFATMGKAGVGSYPEVFMKTSADGKYLFHDLSRSEYGLMALASGYNGLIETFSITESEELTFLQRYWIDAGLGRLKQHEEVTSLQLYPNRCISLDYVYQPNGSRDFTSPGCRKGTINWLNGEGGLNFSEGIVGNLAFQDLNLLQIQDDLYFRGGYSSGENGFYDAGVVPMDSVKEAAEYSRGIYTLKKKPCLVGHVYVVRTLKKGEYCKLIVRSNELDCKTGHAK